MLGPLRRWLDRAIVPRSLFWRSLLIVVVPLLILQLLLTYIFYNRHWDTVTRWLAFGVAGEVALLAETIEEAPSIAARDAFIERAQRSTDLRIRLIPDGRLDDAVAAAGIGTNVGHIDNKILEGFAERLPYPFAVDLETERSRSGRGLRPGQARRLSGGDRRRKRVTSTTTWLLLAWMVGGSVVLSAIAIFFMRLQVRPIRQLARAADSFGKGRDVGDFRPRGALEIRQAAHAFNLMRHRILRHISQRTEMLAAVSHDLRTPLTRMRLELELLGAGDDPVLAGLAPGRRRDVEAGRGVSGLRARRGPGAGRAHRSRADPGEHAPAGRAQRRGS